MSFHNLDAALGYAAGSSRVFPARTKNDPRVKWRDKATTDEKQIIEWWSQWPNDLVCTPTGEIDVVLDVDPPCGLDSLDELGFSQWFETPTVHTARRGLHAHFRVPLGNIRNTTGSNGRGIGVNLDWRGFGGFVALPSPTGNYSWDPILTLDMPLMEVPAALMPRELPQRAIIEPAKGIQKKADQNVDRQIDHGRPTSGLDPYGEAAIEAACNAIVRAPKGEQEHTLNNECLSLGSLAGAGRIPAGLALRTLLRAALQMPDYNPDWPWRPEEINYKVRRSFEHGMAHPRGRVA